jgi:hypothetical protein
MAYRLLARNQPLTSQLALAVQGKTSDPLPAADDLAAGKATHTNQLLQAVQGNIFISIYAWK